MAATRRVLIALNLREQGIGIGTFTHEKGKFFDLRDPPDGFRVESRTWKWNYGLICRSMPIGRWEGAIYFSPTQSRALESFHARRI